jgi:hypothetical protein
MTPHDGGMAPRSEVLAVRRAARATFAPMRFAASFYFAYFWFSHRTAAGEAQASK